MKRSMFMNLLDMRNEEDNCSTTFYMKLLNSFPTDNILRLSKLMSILRQFYAYCASSSFNILERNPF